MKIRKREIVNLYCKSQVKKIINDQSTTPLMEAIERLKESTERLERFRKGRRIRPIEEVIEEIRENCPKIGSEINEYELF